MGSERYSDVMGSVSRLRAFAWHFVKPLCIKHLKCKRIGILPSKKIRRTQEADRIRVVGQEMGWGPTGDRRTPEGEYLGCWA